MTNAGVNSSTQGKYTAANGIEIYYEEHGSGKPLLLLHGGLATSRSWELHVGTLARYFRVITPDARGYGRTRNPAGQLSYQLLTDDTAALIQALGLKKPFVFGWSDGGQIAMELGMRYPDVAGAIVVGGAWKEQTDSYFQSLKAIGFERPGTINLEQMERAIPGVLAVWRDLHAEQGPDYWRELLNAIATLWLTPIVYADTDFANISAPTLVLLGDRDQVIPVEQAVSMYRLISGAELAIVPGGDHALMTKHVNIVAGVILEFLLRQAHDRHVA